jgi:hypothetical protein
MHGAALLYNMMLADRLNHAEWIEKYREALSDWAETSRSDEHAAWDRGALGIVAKAIDYLWDRVRRIDVIYIYSNLAIAKQNVRKLNLSRIHSPGGREESVFRLWDQGDNYSSNEF